MIDWLATRKELDTVWAAADTKSRRLGFEVVSLLLELSEKSLNGSWKLIESRDFRNVETSGLLLDAVPWKFKNCRN